MLCLYVCLCVCVNKNSQNVIHTFSSLSLCLCVCVCVGGGGGGACKDLHPGTIWCFNHLTGDVRQVGTSPDHKPCQSTSNKLLDMFDIFNAYFKN